MINNNTISLIKDLLDITLDFQLIYIENLNDDFKIIEKYLPYFLTINKEYFNKFIKFIVNTKEKYIYSIVDPVFANYIVICLDEVNKDYLLLGPYISTKDSSYKLEQYNLTLDEVTNLKNYYEDLPLLNKHKMTNILRILLKNVCDKDYKVEFVEKTNLFNLNFKNNKDINELINSLESKSLDEISSNEYKLFFAIREGDKFLASRFLDRLLPQKNINSNDFTNIRDYKNKLIYYNTLLKKAAELESISTVYLQSLYYTNLKKIESSNYFNELYDLIYGMIIGYCDAINNYKLKDYSTLVRKVVDYINLNLVNDLSVKNLADLFYISPTYLARIFKKEVNYSIVEYINRQRIRRSTLLLKDSNLPVNQISQIVGINDFNYFSRLFKKYMNKTPSQYRKEIS